MITPTFQNVDGSEYKLQDIVVVGDNVTGDGDVVIQIMSDQGEWIGEYDWFTVDGWGSEKDGWYSAGDEEDADVTLKSGQAILVSCDNEDVSFQVSGQVADGSRNAVFVGYTMSGNSSPVEIDLQDLIPQGENITGDGDIVIQVMSAQGEWIGEFDWFTVDGWGSEKDGWYTAGDEEYADLKLPPGASVLVSCDNEGVEFTVPSPLK